MVDRSFTTNEEFTYACRASAMKYNARRMRLGLMFRAAQEEAYAAWDAWDNALGGEREEVEHAPVTLPVGAGLIERLKELYQYFRPVVPRTGLVVEFASPASTTDITGEYIIPMEELIDAFRVQPYIRIDLAKRRTGARVKFLLERIVDPKHPGRYLNPKAGTIEVCLIRPRTQDTITARLGGHGAGGFEDFTHWINLDSFEEGEESQWQAGISFDVTQDPRE